MAQYFECRINIKNALLQTAFSAILPTGKGLFQKKSVLYEYTQTWCNS